MQRLTQRTSVRHLVLIAVACAVALVAAGGVFGFLKPADASSHREAPFITEDPEADATDVYAYRSPDNPDTVTLLANYVPLEVPAAGPNFYKFGDEVLYEFNIDNNGDAQDDLTFQFRFDDRINNGDTFLYNTGPLTSLDDPDLNQEQFYSVSVFEGGADDTERQGQVIAEGLQAAPYNVGPASFPEGYGSVANEAIYDIGDGIKAFAGPRDDPFFADLGGTFDLLQFRALQGLAPVDDLGGLNVQTLALQVPISMLEGPNDSIIGVRSTSYRQSTNVLRDVGKPGGPFPEVRTTNGPEVQLSRLDNPLVNEVIIPLRDKDRWNASEPADDAQFLEYVQDPEPARLLNALFGLEVPPTPREDLVSIFLTGIPDLNQPANVTPSSQLRLNMAIPPSADPNPLGVLGGDNAGFPNGRRPVDDVVDIELTAVAGGTPFTPEFNDDAHQISDGVDANDLPFQESFPFLACPTDYTGSSCGETSMSATGGTGGPLPGGSGDVQSPAPSVEPDTADGTADESGKDNGALQSVLQRVADVFSG